MISNDPSRPNSHRGYVGIELVALDELEEDTGIDLLADTDIDEDKIYDNDEIDIKIHDLQEPLFGLLKDDDTYGI